MSIHINAKEGDFAKVVLMPGDPLRAKWIAENLLHDAKLVTDVRGILGFTGYTKNNIRLSVMASGMGMPSIGIYSHELFESYGVEVIIRVGTCGSYQPDIDLFDIIIGATASTDSNWGKQFGVYGSYSVGADFELAAKAREIAIKNNIPYHAGNIVSSDVFYDDNKDSWRTWARLGCLAVEMESYALYCNANLMKKKALCLLTVSDCFTKNAITTQEERVTGLKNMLELAIAVAEEVTPEKLIN